MTHNEIRELLGVFALDALDGEEADAVRRHLVDCPHCRGEVADHREVAALLAYAGAPAPPQLWDRIASRLEEPPPALELQPARAHPPERTPRRMVSLRAAAVAFAVAAASIIGLGVEVVRLDRRLPAAPAPVTLADRIAYAETVPGAVKVRMGSSAGAWADAVVLPNGEGYLVDAKLTPLPAGHVYQLWGQVQGHLISLGVLGSDPNQAAFPSQSNTTLLAMTAEAAPGVAVSQQKPVVAGPVNA
jgi:anti-sigma factor RsiW